MEKGRYVLSECRKRRGDYLTETYSEGTFEDVARYKFEQAEDDLETAKILLAAGKYKAANNRAYYACFHAVDAVLAKEPIAFKKHKDTLSYFIIKLRAYGNISAGYWT